MTKIEYWEVYDNYGDGEERVIGRFYKQNLAKEYAIDKGNYGRVAKIRKISIWIAHSIQDIIDIDFKEKREKILAKLSPKEQEILGIKQWP